MSDQIIEGTGFRVDPKALDDAATGIDHSVASQSNFALSRLCGPSSLYGHAGVHSELKNLCTRWSDGLDRLTDDAAKISSALGRTAREYRNVDEQNGNNITGDPGIRVVAGG